MKLVNEEIFSKKENLKNYCNIDDFGINSNSPVSSPKATYKRLRRNSVGAEKMDSLKLFDHKILEESIKKTHDSMDSLSDWTCKVCTLENKGRAVM